MQWLGRHRLINSHLLGCPVSSLVRQDRVAIAIHASCEEPIDACALAPTMQDFSWRTYFWHLHFARTLCSPNPRPTRLATRRLTGCIGADICEDIHVCVGCGHQVIDGETHAVVSPQLLVAHSRTCR